MPNFMKMMKQAASMQKDMERVQGELAEKTLDFSAGGGMVTATARGDGTLARIKIDPKVVNPAEVDLLEDLVTAAVDGALTAAKEMAAKELGKITAGLNIPGLG
jgi:DNA-binding YbaB/EbfC family protein